MAVKTIQEITSDISNESGASTVRFSLDNADFEIDLTEAEAASLREAFSSFIGHARKVSGKTAGGRKASTSTSTKRDDLDKIREFAKANNIEVASRGRIAQSVIDQYDAQKSA